MAPDFASLIEDNRDRERVLRPLDMMGASTLMAALLSGEVPAPERAALLATLHSRAASLTELTGYARALDAHTGRLEMPRDGPRPVVVPAYGGTRHQANLTALLALLLQRYGVPVLVHGLGASDAADGGAYIERDAGRHESAQGRVATADVLWELGIRPTVSLAETQARLLRDAVAYVPATVLAPGLAPLLASSSPRSPLPLLARLLDPFAGASYRVIGVPHVDELSLMRDFLRATHACALLLVGTEGEPFANPRRQPRLEHFADGVATVCAEAEMSPSSPAPELPVRTRAPDAAAWIERVLAGTQPVPPPLIAQLGCCLAGARRLGVAA